MITLQCPTRMPAVNTVKYSRRLSRIQRKLDNLSDDEFWDDDSMVKDLRAQVEKGQQRMLIERYVRPPHHPLFPTIMVHSTAPSLVSRTLVVLKAPHTEIELILRLKPYVKFPISLKGSQVSVLRLSTSCQVPTQLKGSRG